MSLPDEVEDPARVEGRRRFGRLPDPIVADDMVETVPEPPHPEPGFDPNAAAVRRYGTPL